METSLTCGCYSPFKGHYILCPKHRDYIKELGKRDEGAAEYITRKLKIKLDNLRFPSLPAFQD